MLLCFDLILILINYMVCYKKFFFIYRLTIPVHTRSEDSEKISTDSVADKVITAETHIIPNRGPYVYSQPKR